jgi:hypothetical protein
MMNWLEQSIMHTRGVARGRVRETHELSGSRQGTFHYTIGTAVESASTTTIHVDLIKGWHIEWPRLETDELLMAIGSARPLEDATRIAYHERVLWMEKEYGFDRWDAYMMLSQCGKVRLGNFVDPKYSVGAAISKKYLAPADQGDATMDLKLKGLKALVTGGTKGIGRAIAQTLAAEGAYVRVQSRITRPPS